MSPSQEPPPAPAPVVEGRLIGLFRDRPLNDHGSGWSSLWDRNESELWDRGKPSPALIDLIEQERHLFQPIKPDGRRKKALVPGCGKGYDVIMLALHGFDVYGLEISASGVSVAKEYAATELSNPQEYNFGSAWTGPVTPGSVSFIQGDFFKSDLEDQVSSGDDVRFDLVYDYTFLCALHPQLRPQWVARMEQLVALDGVLVCLEFPMYKSPTAPGPPWGLNGVHWDLLARGGDGLAHIGKETEVDRADELPGRFRRLLYRKPARSYEAGRGVDMLSVYAPK
ncbi:hypothetical protein BBP40_001176 [Aspergillus hancockii]|nr:hypothetical protein BBP40_001176 [Aspergillus hancockii]